MQILNTAGYKFISLENLPVLKVELQDKCSNLELKGTILLSDEGINLNLAGIPENIETFKTYLQNDQRFNDMTYRNSYSDFLPFDHLKIKLKEEIITFKRPEVRPEESQAPLLEPIEFKNWLDEKRDITILDTRNEYEVRFGTFAKAVNLPIMDFSSFPESLKAIDRDKPIVTFCTGGIRCEKAALYLLNAGFREVYQLKGGILNYFAEVGGAHYNGECFVFDQRVALNDHLEPSGSLQCMKCEGPVKGGVDTICVDCR